MSLFGRFTASTSQFANKRGYYAGRRSAKLHVAIYRKSGGRLGGHLPGWPKARIVLSTTLAPRVARGGLPRHVPGGRHSIVVAANNGGQPNHPGWFHNLSANPETTIQIGPEIRAVRARLASNEERDRLWSGFVAFYPGYEFFKSNAKGRKIPL